MDDERIEGRVGGGLAETGFEIGGKSTDRRVAEVCGRDLEFPIGVRCRLGEGGEKAMVLERSRESLAPIGMWPCLSATLQEYTNTHRLTDNELFGVGRSGTVRPWTPSPAT